MFQLPNSLALRKSSTIFMLLQKINTSHVNSNIERIEQLFLYSRAKL